MTSNWSLTQPSVDITDTSIQEWSSDFTVTIDGTTSAQTKVFTSPSGSIQVATDIESDNYVAGTSGWKIERDTGNAEFQNATIRGTLNATDITAGTLEADHIKLTGSQLENSGGALVISSGGVDTAQIANNAVIGQAYHDGVSFTGLYNSSEGRIVCAINGFVKEEDSTQLLFYFSYMTSRAASKFKIYVDSSSTYTASYTTNVTSPSGTGSIYSYGSNSLGTSSTSQVTTLMVTHGSLGLGNLTAGTYNFAVHTQGFGSSDTQTREHGLLIQEIKR